ncbi:MAG: hypothetical protein GY742_19720 [Hyphomicrobiales bacterium]|nr:hypothetical protein [Hyphomicrobiales bacterium]
MDIRRITGTNVEQLQFDIRSAVGQISKTTDPETACSIAEQFFLSRQLKLISVIFCDRNNPSNVVRPFRNAPEKLTNIRKKMGENGICPITVEALRLLHPFEISKIDRSRFDDLLSNRFLDELSKCFSNGVFVVPVILGRGLGQLMISSNNGPFSSEDKLLIIDAVCQIAVAIICRFPEVTTFFESKRLSTLEAEALFLNSSGYTDSEIGGFLNLSDITIGLIMKTAEEKLKAKNRSQAIANAIAFGEIFSTQFRYLV